MNGLQFQIGTMTATVPYKVQADGSSSSMFVSAIAGAVPSIGDRVLWARTGRLVIVVTFDWTAW